MSLEKSFFDEELEALKKSHSEQIRLIGENAWLYRFIQNDFAHLRQPGYPKSLAEYLNFITEDIVAVINSYTSVLKIFETIYVMDPQKTDDPAADAKIFIGPKRLNFFATLSQPDFLKRITLFATNKNAYAVYMASLVSFPTYSMKNETIFSVRLPSDEIATLYAENPRLTNWLIGYYLNAAVLHNSYINTVEDLLFSTRSLTLGVPKILNDQPEILVLAEQLATYYNLEVVEIFNPALKQASVLSPKAIEVLSNHPGIVKYARECLTEDSNHKPEEPNLNFLLARTNDYPQYATFILSIAEHVTVDNSKSITIALATAKAKGLTLQGRVAELAGKALGDNQDLEDICAALTPEKEITINLYQTAATSLDTAINEGELIAEKIVQMEVTPDIHFSEEARSLDLPGIWDRNPKIRSLIEKVSGFYGVEISQVISGELKKPSALTPTMVVALDDNPELLERVENLNYNPNAQDPNLSYLIPTNAYPQYANFFKALIISGCSDYKDILSGFRIAHKNGVLVNRITQELVLAVVVNKGEKLEAICSELTPERELSIVKNNNTLLKLVTGVKEGKSLAAGIANIELPFEPWQRRVTRTSKNSAEPTLPS